MTAYYNEIDEYAAQWLRNLIAAGHIAPGVVDTRSIEDVNPEDLRGFTQCHFFAGVGVWSLALRRAGWADDRAVWTGSCPCQPFSAAGKGAGFDDERHLWPHFHYLINQCQPAVILGEQVASSDSGPWIDLVHTDLEALGYAFGAVPFPSAGVGAPHIRDRLYWGAISLAGRRMGTGGQLERLADADRRAGGERRADVRGRTDRGDAQSWARLGGRGVSDGLANDIVQQRQDWESRVGVEHEATGRIEGAAATAGLCGAGRLEHADGIGFDGWPRGAQESRRNVREPVVGASSETLRPGPTNGLWRDADWLACRDGKWRPVEPGTFPLAHGATSRVGRLRAYGNAINAEAARVFIEAVMESLP